MRVRLMTLAFEAMTAEGRRAFAPRHARRERSGSRTCPPTASRAGWRRPRAWTAWRRSRSTRASRSAGPTLGSPSASVLQKPVVGARRRRGHEQPRRGRDVAPARRAHAPPREPARRAPPRLGRPLALHDARHDGRDRTRASRPKTCARGCSAAGASWRRGRGPRGLPATASPRASTRRHSPSTDSHAPRASLRPAARRAWGRRPCRGALRGPRRHHAPGRLRPARAPRVLPRRRRLLPPVPSRRGRTWPPTPPTRAWRATCRAARSAPPRAAPPWWRSAWAAAAPCSSSTRPPSVASGSASSQLALNAVFFGGSF